MRKLAFLPVAFALVAVSFYGCDDNPAALESAESDVTEQDPAFTKAWDDEDNWWRTDEVYLDCLDETVVIEGEFNWVFTWGKEAEREQSRWWWTPEETTMVGPSGTWTIVNQFMRERAFYPKDVYVNRVTWRNEATGALLRVWTYRRYHYDTGSYREEGPTCRLLGRG